MHKISGLLADPEGLTAVCAVLQWTSLSGFTVMTGTWVCACVCRPSGPAGLALNRVLNVAWTAVWGAGLVMQLASGPLTTADVRSRAVLFVLLTAGWGLARHAITHPQVRLRARVAAMVAAVVLALAVSALWWLCEVPQPVPRLPPPPAALAVQALKLAAIAVWLGGLVSLGSILLVEKEPLRALAAARSFSPAALVSLHVLMGTVNMEAWQRIGKAPALLLTGYGRLLLAQIGALTLLLALDALARACLVTAEPRALPGDETVVRAESPTLRVVLHRSLAVQLAVGIALFTIIGPAPLVSAGPPVPAR